MKTYTDENANTGGSEPATKRPHLSPHNLAYQKRYRRHAMRFYSTALILICTFLTSTPVLASIEGKIFPFVTYSRITGESSTNTLDKESLARGADLFGLISHNDWRVLGEVLLDNTEGDLERLQFGRWVTDNTLLWMGRYHTPTAYWDMVYHHSPYLQTSISRPQIMEYEDDGGLLTTHIWGLLADHTITKGNKEWQLEFGFGAAPTVTTTGLKPIAALDPKPINNRMAAEFAVSYMPDVFSTNEVGIFASTMELPSDRTDVEHVRQTQAGTYISWSMNQLRTISSIFAVHSNVQSPTDETKSHTFYSGYFHLEYQLLPKWRPYIRYEGSIGTKNDPYINLFTTGLPNSKIVAGLRFDVTSHQGITFEAIRSEGEYTHHYNQFMLQWSAMFP